MATRAFQYIAPVPCTKSLCMDEVLGDDTYCEKCHMVLCRRHFDDASHACRYCDVEWKGLPGGYEIGAERLKALLAALRPGHTSSIDAPDWVEKYDWTQSGIYNQHIPVRFDDGVEWMISVPHPTPGAPPADLLRRVLVSEVATYKALREQGVPVAEVFGWGVGQLRLGQNTSDTHLIYEKMPGYEDPALGRSIPHADVEQDPTVISLIKSYARHMIRLSSRSYEQIGALDLDEQTGKMTVGNYIPFPQHNTSEPPYFGGPFDTMQDCLLWRIDTLLGLIKQGYSLRNTTLMSYLVHLELRSLVTSHKPLAVQEKEFYIKHVDPSAQNMLVQDGEITALVDWEWATTVKAEAFGAPFWIRDQCQFHEGNDGLSAREVILQEAYRSLGRPDLADCVSQARIYQRIAEVLGHPHLEYEDVDYWCHTTVTLNSLVRAFLGPKAGKLPRSPPQWKKLLLKKYKSDPYLSAVIELDETIKRKRRAGRIRSDPWPVGHLRLAAAAACQSVKRVLYNIEIRISSDRHRL